jgi:hypothetical protein
MPSTPFNMLSVRSMFYFLRNLFPAFAELWKIPVEERNLAIIRVLYRLLGLPPDTPNSYGNTTPEQRLYARHDIAWQSYQPQAFSGVVTVLRPTRTPIFHPDPMMGWRSVKGQRLEVRIVPGVGIHGECLKSGAGIAEVIEGAIAERERAKQRG